MDIVTNDEIIKAVDKCPRKFSRNSLTIAQKTNLFTINEDDIKLKDYWAIILY